MKFNKRDVKLIQKKGLTPERVLNQIEIFKKGIRYIDIKKPATVEDGILRLSKEEQEELAKFYEQHKQPLNIVKFTPASGAASRMFKFLFNFLETFNGKKESINAYINKHKDNDLRLFFIGLDKFPFYGQVTTYIRQILGEDTKRMSTDNFCRLFVEVMLLEKHLDLGTTPKGLLPFHEYKKHISSPFQEHLYEANRYICNNGIAHLHFTVSPQHLKFFKKKEEEIVSHVQGQTDCKFKITYSFQEESTDTVAVDFANKPIRDEDRNLVFRPGGHGALIENLNKIDADIIFIKNIDNVVTNSYEERVVSYKRVLGGMLLQLQTKTHAYLKTLEEAPDRVDLQEVLDFMHEELNIRVNEEFEKYAFDYQIEYLVKKLDRPLRVCGMVKNENEPGGGPFWVKHENGYVSLQIVESAQVNKKGERQKKIFESSTHFNPVDIVCGVRNHRREKYDLKKFVDNKTYFIASKSKSGKKIKALERPGLWNGGMAFWNTVFVEVPLYTFNPVKTVNDLLKPTHQKDR